MSRDLKIYLALWRKLIREQEKLPVEIVFPTTQQAASFRIGMFKALKPYRHNGRLDMELSQAADLITIKKMNGCVITFDHRTTDTMLDSVVQQMGLSKELLKRSEAEMLEAAAEQSLREALDGVPEPRSTPFFERD